MNELRATDIVADGRRRVIAIEALGVDRYRDGVLCGLQARLELRAVIVLEDGAITALGSDGRDLPLADLASRFPALATLLPDIFGDRH